MFAVCLIMFTDRVCWMSAKKRSSVVWRYLHTSIHRMFADCLQTNDKCLPDVWRQIFAGCLQTNVWKQIFSRCLQTNICQMFADKYLLDVCRQMFPGCLKTNVCRKIFAGCLQTNVCRMFADKCLPDVWRQTHNHHHFHLYCCPFLLNKSHKTFTGREKIKIEYGGERKRKICSIPIENRIFPFFETIIFFQLSMNKSRLSKTTVPGAFDCVHFWSVFANLCPFVSIFLSYLRLSVCVYFCPFVSKFVFCCLICWLSNFDHTKSILTTVSFFSTQR